MLLRRLVLVFAACIIISIAEDSSNVQNRKSSRALRKKVVLRDDNNVVEEQPVSEEQRLGPSWSIFFKNPRGKRQESMNASAIKGRAGTATNTPTTMSPTTSTSSTTFKSPTTSASHTKSTSTTTSTSPTTSTSKITSTNPTTSTNPITSTSAIASTSGYNSSLAGRSLSLAAPRNSATMTVSTYGLDDVIAAISKLKALNEQTGTKPLDPSKMCYECSSNTAIHKEAVCDTNLFRYLKHSEKYRMRALCSSDSSKFCYKTVLRQYGERITKRGCFSSKLFGPNETIIPTRDGCVTFKKDGYLGKTCFCSKKLCNGESRPVVHLEHSLIQLLILFLHTRFIFNA